MSLRSSCKNLLLVQPSLTYRSRRFLRLGTCSNKVPAKSSAAAASKPLASATAVPSPAPGPTAGLGVGVPGLAGLISDTLIFSPVTGLIVVGDVVPGSGCAFLIRFGSGFGVVTGFFARAAAPFSTAVGTVSGLVTILFSLSLFSS